MEQQVWGPGEYVALVSIALGGMYLLSRLASWIGGLLGRLSSRYEPVEESAEPDVLSSTVLPPRYLELVALRIAQETRRTVEPNGQTEPANRYQKLTERQQLVAEKAIRAGLTLTDLCVAFGGTKQLRLLELRPIKERIEAEQLAQDIADPTIEVG